MTLNDTEKINFIKNNFHQYVDLTLNTEISTTETVNLVIPMKKLTKEEYGTPVTDNYTYDHDITFEENYDINEILKKYPDTEYTEDECIPCICTNVVDGDTIDVKLIIKGDDGHLTFQDKRIRLAGVNAPEEGRDGYEVSKDFLRKICYDEVVDSYNKIMSEDFKYFKITDYPNSIRKGETKSFKVKLEKKEETDVIKNKRVFLLGSDDEFPLNTRKLYLKIDNIRPIDPYGRTRAVLIYQKKNINEVLLKEKLAEVWYIPPSEFYPFNWASPNTRIHTYQFENDSIEPLYPYFNSTVTNVVFTPRDDPTKIYKFDFYKGVFFIRMQPFSQHIRMHLLPRGYDCSNEILIFKDEMIKENNINTSNDYYHYSDVNNPINSYYLVDERIRDRKIPSISTETYNATKWSTGNIANEKTNTFCEFSYDISKNTRNINKLQICSGYQYNKSSPYYSVHYTGIKDNTNVSIEDRCTLIDANFDKVLGQNQKENHITQFNYNSNKQLYIPRVTRISRANYTDNVDHISDEVINKTHHKIIKYINDIMYSEEDVEGTKTNTANTNYKRYAVSNWVDVSNQN